MQYYVHSSDSVEKSYSAAGHIWTNLDLLYYDDDDSFNLKRPGADLAFVLMASAATEIIYHIIMDLRLPKRIETFLLACFWLLT